MARLSWRALLGACTLLHVHCALAMLDPGFSAKYWPAQQGLRADVFSQAQLVEAFQNQSVTEIVLQVNITTTPDAWPPDGTNRVIRLFRNVTVASADPSRFTWLDFAYMKRHVDVHMDSNMTGQMNWLKFTNLTLYSVRSPLQHQSPGTDFVGVSLNQVLILENVLLLYDVMIPTAILVRYANTVQRPANQPALNGSLTLQDIRAWPDPYCWPTAGVCYNSTAHMVDYALAAYRVELEGQRINQGGVVWNVNVTAASKAFINASCLAQSSTYPCIAAWVEAHGMLWADKFDVPSFLDLPPPAPPAPETSDSSDNNKSVRLGVGIGVGVGGALLLAGLAGLGMLVVGRRRKAAREERELQKYYSSQGTDHNSHIKLTPGVSEAFKLSGDGTFTTDSFALTASTAGIRAAGDASSDVITATSPAIPVPMDIDVERDVKILTDAFIGAGSYGRVYECMYHGQRCAIKVVHANIVATENAGDLEALRKEVEIMSKCTHPNIVRLLAANLQPPNLCIITELLSCSLKHVVHDSSADLPLSQVLAIARDVAAGLAYLHPTVMHRDLKPANVLIDFSGTAKLADFGLARLRLTATMGTAHTAHPASGTMQYMAPECFDQAKHSVTHKSDIYSLGVLIWEMLVRKQPWLGQSYVRVMYLVTVSRERLPIPPESKCPKQLRRLLEECWDADPQRRPSAAEVQKRLAVMAAREAQRTESGSRSGTLPVQSVHAVKDGAVTGRVAGGASSEAGTSGAQQQSQNSIPSSTHAPGSSQAQQGLSALGGAGGQNGQGSGSAAVAGPTPAASQAQLRM